MACFGLRSRVYPGADAGWWSMNACERSMVDDDLERRLDVDGYVVVDLFDAAAVESLGALARRVHAEPQAGYDSDFFSSDPAVKREVNVAIGAAMRAGLERHLVDHRSILHSFVLNWPGPDGGLVLHQHTTVVDERRFRSLVAWCAITSAHEGNGTLHVVPGSHRLQRGIHPERARSWAEDHRSTLMAEHLVSIELEPGQALLFDNRLVHGSIPNLTPEPRISAVAVIVPNEADPCYHEAVDERTVRIYRLVPDFFTDRVAVDFSWPSPEGLPIVDEVEWTPVTVTAAELVAAVPRGTCNHPEHL